MADKDISLSFLFLTCCLMAMFVLLLIIKSTANEIITNECENSPVEQFRNSEYCEVKR